MSPATTGNSTPNYTGKFRYVSKDAKLEVNPNLYHLPPMSAFSDVLNLPLTDLRPSLQNGDASPYKLDIHGFTARHIPSKLHASPYTRESWNDADLIRDVYAPEVEELVKRVTGCKTALVEAAVLRNNTSSELDCAHSKEKSGADYVGDDPGPRPRMIGFSDAGGASPAPKVHLDFSPIGARTHIRQYHRDLSLAAKDVIEAENSLLKSGVKWEALRDHYIGVKPDGGIPRFAIFSIWRPLKTVRRDPIAVASCATYPTSDYVPVDLVQPSGRLIPSDLYQIIDPSHPEIDYTKQTGDVEKYTHLSGSYLSYAPSEKGSHEWHFISNQEPKDVLFIQLFDNHMEAKNPSIQSDGTQANIPVSGVIHSAFELEGQDGYAEARESLEVRVVAFW
ncbi:uncharacterized protein N7483_004068 [Penicillium malachiteum]|uniref:uncharacterized protein n=1 Tax=Penicillium malachiteum TaxID=1324776 RepID=UPI002548AB10|nr:uncharacterized protein N7483_004068 [Penicillium malachiteum]KAJ5729560.1 hypothetical protein N7483_004068 [Penicillium malachiteum]